MIRFIFFFFISIIFYSCGSRQGDFTSEKELQRYLQDKPVYLIQTGYFSTKDSAKVYAGKLQKETNFLIYIQKINNITDSARSISIKKVSNNTEEKYCIQIGKFNSSYEAGKTAYELFTNGIINSYEIIRNKKVVFNNFADLFFVGKTSKTNCIYRTNIFSNKLIKIWSEPDETIADLDYSPLKSSAFFVTVSQTGYNGILPYIKKAKLYFMNETRGIVKNIKNFGDCIQLSSNWESPEHYRVILLSFDKKNPVLVLENDLTFNETGVVLNEDNRIIDLAKENFPQITGIQGSRLSSNGRFRLSDSLSDNKIKIFLTDNKSKVSKLIVTSKIQLNKIAWTEDNKCLVFSTLGIFLSKNKSKVTGLSKLYIYNIEKDKMISPGSEEGLKNFLIRGDLVIFDDRFKANSRIYVYSIMDNKIINNISVKGGCGICNVPAIPGN